MVGLLSLWGKSRGVTVAPFVIPCAILSDLPNTLYVKFTLKF